MAPYDDVIVIGGGIVGLATARAVLLADPAAKVTVLEKEEGVGRHQSGHNSGVLHSGIYYTPGSLKARLCRRGKALMEAYASDHEIPVHRLGKLIVAVCPSELPRFAALADRARSNGVPGLAVLGPVEMAEVEPNIRGLRALHCPGTSAIDFGLVCEALAADVLAAGGQLRTRSEVFAVHESGDDVTVETAGGNLRSRAVIACAGLQADRLAGRSGHRSAVRIVPFRGSWFRLRSEAAALIRGNVYPVPDPRYPFLGVHFSRRVDGAVWAGPNAVLAGAREGYHRTALDLRDVGSSLTFPGTWRLVRRHFATGVAELYRDHVKAAALRTMQRYLPELSADALIPGPLGVRAQAVRADGSMIDDFLIEGTTRVMHVLNAPSPGATSSLAIGEVLAGEAAKRLACV